VTAALVQHVDFGIHTSGTGGAGGGAVSSTTFAASISSATAGNLLIVAAACLTLSGSSNVMSITDNLGGTWTQIAQMNTASRNSGMWWKEAAGGETTVTVTLTDARTCVWEVREYSGIVVADPIDAYTQSPQVGSGAGSGATEQPTYQDGVHLYWCPILDTRSKANMEASLSTSWTRGEIATTGWIRHGAEGYAGVPSRDTGGGTRTQDMRNGTYTGDMLCAWMLHKLSGTASNKAHISVRAETSAVSSVFWIAVVLRTTSTPTETENGTGTGAASVVGTGSGVSGSGTTITLNTPTHVSGDLLLAFIGRSEGITLTPPSGWTQWPPELGYVDMMGEGGDWAGGMGADPNQVSVWFRCADGTEGGSYAWTLSSGTTYAGTMICVRTSSPYTGTDWQLQDPLGHLHHSGIVSGGFWQVSGRREVPDEEDVIYIFLSRQLNSISSATGWTTVSLPGTANHMVFWRSVAHSGPWEFRGETTGRADQGGLSLCILGVPPGADHWAWSEESEDSWDHSA